MTATIQFLPEIPAPEQIANFRNLKLCWVIEMPNIIIWSVDKDKCICKAKRISTILRQLNKCD
jgi:hypothetical protein